ncbi:MAG: hypothetical protein CMI20_09275 [Opitutae bacterium]|nr:hypothetical protein [Opitutae bacterium]
MTLRGVVLFPHAMLPLRIFEDRYKKMLSDVLKKDRMFAVVAQREKCDDESSEEPPFEVATIGLVRVSKKNPDGTSFVMLQGVSRIRIRSIIQESPYRVLDAEAFDTIVEKEQPTMRSKIYDALVQNRKLGGEVTNETLEYLNVVDDDATFIDLAAFTLCKNTIRKQAMLEVQRLHKRSEMFFDDLMKENLQLALHKNFTNGGEFPDLDRN